MRLSAPRRQRPRRGLPGFTTLGRQAMINLIAGLFGMVLLAYLAFGQWYWVPIILLVAGLGVDQTLRTHPRGGFIGPAATAMYLFVPVLFALGSALFLRDVSRGLWNLIGAVGAAMLFALAAHAEYLTVEGTAETYPVARFALSLVSYLTAFALFTVVSTSGLSLGAATLIVAVVVMLLTVDILREQDVSSGVLFAYGAATAGVVAEVRWATYYLALPDLAAGALLLITFYEVTGLVQSYLGGQFDRRTISEFGAVGSIALLIIATVSVWSRNA